MSGPLATRAPERTAFHAAKLFFLVWHATCIAVLSSCFYVGPPWAPNRPPEILMPSTDQNELRMIADPEVLVVRAGDPDGDLVFFDWEIPHGVQPASPPHDFPDEDRGHFVSTLQVPRHPNLDGAMIRCHVTDDVNPAVILQWKVEIP